MQDQSNKAESLVRLYDGIVSATEALARLAGQELRGAQAEHLEEEAAARVGSRWHHGTLEGCMWLSLCLDVCVFVSVLLCVSARSARSSPLSPLKLGIYADL